VYFDDFNVTHTKSRIVKYNEYYPFGLQTANSWTREGAVDNKFLNNGGTELNPTTGWYDLAFRNYDPVLGRMHGVDPMASKYASLTPYNYSFNNPVSFTDPNGADPSGYYEGAEPIFEPYTMRMYHPAYGWLQDDHIYERIIGWRGPMARYVGKLDWLFEKPGKRSAFGGWQGNMSMSLSSFFKAAWNHPLGGSWSGGESYLFSNYLQEVRVGWAYVEEHNGWRYVPGGKEGAMARLQQALAAPDLLGVLQQQTQYGPYQKPGPWDLLSEASFNFQNVGSNWQATRVRGVYFIVVDGQTGTTYESFFTLEIGVPKKSKDGVVYSKKEAADRAALVANAVATQTAFVSTFIGPGGRAMTLNSATLPCYFAAQMQLKLNNYIPGSTVTANTYGFPIKDSNAVYVNFFKGLLERLD
jgi:RHS repeat-associated protein